MSEKHTYPSVLLYLYEGYCNKLNYSSKLLIHVSNINIMMGIEYLSETPIHNLSHVK